MAKAINEVRFRARCVAFLQQNDIAVRRKTFLWCELPDFLTIPAGFHSFTASVKVQFVLGGSGCER